MQILLIFLLGLGLLVTQALMGGVRLFFSIPGYAAIALASILVVARSFRMIGSGVRLLPLASALLFAGYVAARCMTSPVEYLARNDLHLILAALAVYLLTACYLNNSQHRWWLLGGIFAFACLHVVCGAMQFVWDDNFMLLQLLPKASPIPQIFRPDYGWRASGFYGCPNHLAGLLETTALFALAACCLGRNRPVARIIYAYTLVMCLVGLALTGSRGGYLSVLGGLIAFSALAAWVIKKLNREKMWVVMLGMCIAAVVLVGGALVFMSHSALIQNRVDTVVDPKNLRLFLWAAAMKQFYLNPFFGTGAGTYLFYGRHFRAPEVQNDPIHTHNDYLELLSEYGGVGAALIVVFVLLHLHSGWQGISVIVRRRLRPTQRVFSDELAILMAAFAAVIALLLHSVVDFNFHIPANTLFFAFIFGVLASPTCDPKLVAPRTTNVTHLVRFLLPALGGVMLFLGVKQIRSEYHAEWARVQLRNQIFVSLLSDVGETLAWSLPSATTGVVAPAVAHVWSGTYLREHLIPKVIEHTTAASLTESQNPELFFYLGEAQYFMALLHPVESERRDFYIAAAEAYRDGLSWFPQDIRLQLRFAAALDDLRFFDEAERVYEKALNEDPNLGNIYAQYGQHLWLQRKLNRATAYFRKAIRFEGGSEAAEAGIQKIERLQALAKNQRYVEEVGDPLEGYDLDPPTSEDEARGVTAPEEK